MTVHCCGVFQITTLQPDLNDCSNEGTDYVFDTYRARSELMIGSGMSEELKAYSFRNCLNWLKTPRFSLKYLVENVDVMFSKYVVVEIFPFAHDTVPLGKLTVSSIVN